MTVCQHKSVFLDEDETKCRVCSQSLTFPARPPAPADEKDRRRDRLAASGEKRRRDSSPVEDQVVTQHQDQEVTPERQAIPSTQLLTCSCCKEQLAQENFHHRNNPAAAKRLFRSYRCRGCVAFGNRIRRQQQPEAIRARDRQRAQRYYLSLTLAQKMQYRTSKEANNLATKRHRARQNGIPVLIQKAGRLPTLVKPICRVAATCPLRSYCTIEGKGVA